MFRLRTLGGLTLERDGEPYAGPATQRRRLALLALLAAADTAVSRDRLTGYLWPETDPERARHSLDDALSALRRELRSDALFLGVASLRLNPDVLASDLADHAAALGSGDVERAVALYAGPFLDGFFVPGAGEFERWVEAERGRRAQAHARVLDRLATAAATRGDGEAAVQWCHARVEADPLDTPATMRLLAALATAGNPTEALRVARVHEALVREEFDSVPGPGWAAAVDAVRAELSRPPPVASLTPARRPVPELLPGTDPTHSDPAAPHADQGAARPAARRWPAGLFVTAGVLVVGLGSYAAWRNRAPALREVAPAVSGRGVAPPASVAVLPFVNTSGDAADEPFADGLTDELISALSKVVAVRVTGRTSAFALKNRRLNVRTIGDTLGVETVLEGSVRRDGNRLRVVTQLVSASDNGVLWAESYDRALEDVFAVQAEIARAIVAALRPTLGAARTAIAPPQTRDLATYELYLKGRYFWGRRTPGDLRRATDYFERAVARDPSYAQAFAGLAEARMLLVMLGGSPPREELPRARVAATEAIRLDSTLAEAHAALGSILEAFDWDMPGADREIARAIALDPGYATARLYRGIQLLNLGRFDDAVAELTRARTLDPLSASVHMQLGRAYVSVRRPAEAVSSLRSAVELSPEFTATYVHLGDAYLQQGEPAAALDAFRRAAALNGGRDSAQIAYALAVTGDRGVAERLLRDLLAAPRRRYLPPVPVAKAYVALGDPDAAFRWLERGYEERAAQMRTIGVMPAFDPLHADPRWARLLGRMRAEP
jgi:TolB-like protein/DNA-binding SARP family transcriptional activator